MAEVYIGIAVYLLAMLGIGYIASRRVTNAADFLVAGRSLPLWLTVGTLSATWFGGGTVLGAAGAAYEKGFIGVIADPFGAALCLLLAGLFFARMLRRMSVMTVVDVFNSRYDKRTGFLAAVATIIIYVGWTGALLVSFGFVLQTITGISTEWAIGIGTAITLIYTMIGGMWAVAWTDFLQIILVVVGLLIAFPVLIKEAGGLEAILSRLPEGSFSMTPEEGGFSNWLFYIRAWIVIGLGNIAGQDLMQRCLAAKDEKTAQTGLYISSGVYLTFGLIPICMGLIGTILMPDIENAELIVPMLVMEYLPTTVVVIFVSALLAAVMSSADSAILATSSVIGKNLIPFAKPDATDANILKWSRWSVPVVTILALMVALYFQNIYNLLVNAFSIALVSLFVPLTAAIWWKKANIPGALASMIVGLVCWIVVPFFTIAIPSDLFGLAMGIIALVVVSLATQRSNEPRPLRNAEGVELALAGRFGNLSPFGTESTD
ncbi:MAG: sodium:solute symporter family protein [Bacteroidetes bacterium]|nr:sodium:solute symporter family protein [Bacteroidota bacterium]